MCRMIGIGWSAGLSTEEDAENAPQLCSWVEIILNGDPAASLTRRRAQTWCSLFVAPCAPEGTPPVISPPAASLDDRFEHPPSYLVIAC